MNRAHATSVQSRSSRKSLSQTLAVVLLILVVAETGESGPLIGPGQDAFDRETGSVSSLGLDLNYELFRPEGHAEPGSIPLVVFLHGLGDGRPSRQARLNETMHDLVHATQHDNAARGIDAELAPRLDEEFSSYLLVPKIPELVGWQSFRNLTRSLIDDVLTRHDIDERRVYLIGFSDGGFATVDFLRLFPDVFSAAMPISGGGVARPSTIEALKDVPLWFFHGEDDPVVLPFNSTGLYDALIAAGGDARLTLVPGGHNAGYEFAFLDRSNEIYPWLFGQGTIPEPTTGLLALTAVAVLAGGRLRRNG